MFWKVELCINKEKQDVLLPNSDSLERFFFHFLIDWREKVGSGGKKMVSGSGSVCIVTNGNDCSSSAGWLQYSGGIIVKVP